MNVCISGLGERSYIGTLVLQALGHENARSPRHNTDAVFPPSLEKVYFKPRPPRKRSFLAWQVCGGGPSRPISFEQAGRFDGRIVVLDAEDVPEYYEERVFLDTITGGLGYGGVKSA